MSPSTSAPAVLCRFVFAWLVCSSPALAVDTAGRVEGGVSIPMTSPQRDYFGMGPGVTGTFELGLHRFFDLEAQVGWILLPTKPGVTTDGTALFFGLGGRGRWRSPTERPSRGSRAWCTSTARAR